MAYDQYLADRILRVFEKEKTIAIEKKMFGGIGFMVDDKMCIGIYKVGLMARVDPEKVGELVKRKGAEQMIHGGRTMKGYLTIFPEGYDLDDDLEFWVLKCLEFNPKTKKSKKKKK
ncbi:MAG: TfoX/Sxy family protein [Bacteroidota bacterium]